MAHEVESMMYVGKTPWHGLGVAIPEREKLSIEKAIVASGLDWQVELRKVFTEKANGSTVEIPEHYASCRTADNAILGVVGTSH